MNKKIGGAQLGWKACSIFQPTSNLGAIRHPSQGTQDLQLRWQVFQKSAELCVIKLASAQNGSDRPTCYAPVGACFIGWEDITGIPDRLRKN